MLTVNHLTGFGGGQRPAITVTDDGDAAPSSGAGGAAHTYNAKTSTGPHTILIVTGVDGSSAVTVTGVTWSAVAMTELVNAGSSAGTDDVGAAIFYIAGAQNGNIVINFSATVNDSEITILSLDNLQSASPTDTDTATSSSAASLTLSAFSASPSGGIRIGAYANAGSATAVTWTWAGHTEASDFDAGTHRHGVAYLIDDTAGGNVTAGGATDRCALVGVTLR